MKYIVSGTNRPNSRTLKIAKIVESIFLDQGQTVELLDLADVPFHEMTGVNYPPSEPPTKLKELTSKFLAAEGIVFIVPEYNGSMPGALKYFIDHWKYPEAFEYRPVCFVGLGGRFGGLRAVEHLQQVFGYRNAFIYPERVFLINIWNTLKDNELNDPMAMNLLRSQAAGFGRFVKALQAEKLDANHRTK